jgi:CRP/FNR family cyclic AMP-dependent transcriptional regulator
MLPNISLFAGLSDDELRYLERHTTSKVYRKNTVIIEKGEESSCLYAIIDGRVKVYLADEEGREILLNTQGPGDCFGELALLSGTPRTASVMTLETCRCLVISRTAFLDCIAAHPELALNLIRGLVERITTLTDNVGSLALQDVYGRVVKTIMHEAADGGDGTLTTGLLTQQVIANRVGASREMVSRILKDLRLGGYISISGHRITVHRRPPVRW